MREGPADEAIASKLALEAIQKVNRVAIKARKYGYEETELRALNTIDWLTRWGLDDA